MTAPDWRDMGPGEFDTGGHGEMVLPIPEDELAAMAGVTFEPGHGPERDLRAMTTGYELTSGTTRKAVDESTLTSMGIGRPLTNPDLGPMRLRTFHEYDPVWEDVLARAEAEGVPAAEVVRRALRGYLNGSFS